MPDLLVIEDDNHINGMIREALCKKGYRVTSAYSGTEGLSYLRQQNFDLVILDLMLPGMAGGQVLKEARGWTQVPVIVLSARDELDTKVDLLTLGANDYMTKPFALEELEARILVWLRHSAAESGKRLSHKSLCMDCENRRVTLEGSPVALTGQEYRILELLLRHPEKVFTKNEIYEYAWNDYYLGEDKTINVHVSNIRQKLNRIKEGEYIETVWGVGFKLAD